MDWDTVIKMVRCAEEMRLSDSLPKRVSIEMAHRIMRDMRSVIGSIIDAEVCCAQLVASGDIPATEISSNAVNYIAQELDDMLPRQVFFKLWYSRSTLKWVIRIDPYGYRDSYL